MALFIGSTIVVLCMVSLSHQICGWNDLGNDLDPKLLGFVAEKNRQGSFAISGHSLITPLEMLVLAAAGETRKQLSNALELQPGQEISPKNFVCNSDKHGRYKEASKLFLGKQYEHNELYDKAIEDVLHSEVGTLDFHNRTVAIKTINKWISDNTNHIITGISPFDISKNTSAVITNTFLLESHWQKPFPVEDTDWDDFYTPTVGPFMRIVERFRVKDVKSMDATAVYIPMKEAKAYMVLVLPNNVDGLQRVLKSLSQDEILKGPVSYQLIELRVPKFEVSTYLDLIDFLKSIGVVDVFTYKSELPNLTKNGTKVIIDEFLQKSHIRIDEKGVNAATANDADGDVLLDKAEPGADIYFMPPKITFDHPFYYGFTESYENGKIYFGGVFRG